MLCYEDVDVGQTAEFGRYEMTREEILDFASKYDPQPFHLSDEGGKHSIFGALCASGWHTCAATMRMMVEQMKAENSGSMGSPGVDEIRWVKPVFPGDILHVHTEVLSKHPSKSRPQIGIIKMRYKVLNQKDEMVMTFIGNGIFPRRNPGDADA